MGLLNIGNNAKTIKGDIKGEYLSAILYLSPSTTSGYDVCPSATEGCKTSCLFTAGRGKMHSVHDARVNKTKMFFENREMFRATLLKEFAQFSKKCNKLNVKPAVRLNGTSDLNWHDMFPELFSDFPQFKFYDYTKSQKIMEKYINNECPSNYHLTFSRSEFNFDFCLKVLNNGHNVAIVFESIPLRYKGFTVFVGDDTDLRFLDPKGVVIGLKAKGKAKKDKSGFVIKPNEMEND